MDLKDPKTQKMILVGVGICVLVYFYVIADYVPFNYPARAKQINTLKATYTQKMKLPPWPPWSMCCKRRPSCADRLISYARWRNAASR